MRTTFFAAAAAAVLLAGCGLGAPDYPQFGEASYRIEGTTASLDGGAATRTVIYRDGPKMRVEAALPNYGQATIVYDDSTNAAYVLNPTGQGAVTTAPTTAPGGQPSTTTATPSPTTQQQATAPSTTPAPGAAPAAPAAAPAPTQVVGVAVRIDDADAPQPLEGAWAALGEDNARSAGKCEVAGENGHLWRPREDSAGLERIACITDDGIVLRVTESGRTLWEATSLERGQQDASLFGVPAGYQLIDPEAVAEQVGENMQQLDSVTGAPPTPQEAPAPRG
jgi:hypothetical protein